MNFRLPDPRPTLPLLVFSMLCACTRSAPEVVGDWQVNGWALVEVLGTEGPIERHGQLTSEKARAIEASWREKGQRKTKVFSQSNERIAVLRFFKKDGDEFVVVLSKRK